MAFVQTHSAVGNLDACLQQMRRGAERVRMLKMKPDVSASEWKDVFLDAVALFEELGIRYALIGGVAAMYYGRARFTEDVDFVAATGHEATLAAHPQVMQKHHFDPGCTWKLHHASGVNIDLWKDGFADRIIQRSVKASLAGREVWIAEPHDLIAMKLRADRPQDDYDISEIIKAMPIHDEMVCALVTTEQFQRYLALRQRMEREPRST